MPHFPDRRLADLRTMIARFLPLLLLSCGATHAPVPKASVLPYDPSEPISVITLPDLLIGISALTDVDSDTVACVQDEAGTVYFISLSDGRKVHEIPFVGPGDMEGPTRVDRDFFA